VTAEPAPPALSELRRCFEGLIPSIIATAAADGTPNVTHLSKVHYVDETHVALSNQFFSKTMRNLAEHPHASVLVIDPVAFRWFRLTLRYERTERRGPLFDQLSRDIDAIAALTGMADVFKLKSADVYRVAAIEPITTAGTEVEE
jgi:hypothetical protein